MDYVIFSRDHYKEATHKLSRKQKNHGVVPDVIFAKISTVEDQVAKIALET